MKHSDSPCSMYSSFKTKPLLQILRWFWQRLTVYWFFNLVAFIMGVMAAIAGYKSNSMVVTASGVCAAFAAFISCIVQGQTKADARVLNERVEILTIRMYNLETFRHGNSRVPSARLPPRLEMSPEMQLDSFATFDSSSFSSTTDVHVLNTISRGRGAGFGDWRSGARQDTSRRSVSRGRRVGSWNRKSGPCDKRPGSQDGITSWDRRSVSCESRGGFQGRRTGSQDRRASRIKAHIAMSKLLFRKRERQSSLDGSRSSFRRQERGKMGIKYK
ncbi:hypothetical protein DFJ43DRAFT_667721 [Lentinula guzmanii]|uniref:Uncharacterized protein n=1 Tax=Lentinula guzmanii TaxID=2804957 RepID=A0AA38MY24_9AGAR|nr:hypothetical protein DFJ43DRAFT_667721 [Lentinula guzmanii]KAJ3800955.1 hypothetical protein GGU11DRAFT_315214 [Lentinula aff. detonsa]